MIEVLSRTEVLPAIFAWSLAVSGGVGIGRIMGALKQRTR